MAEIIDGVGFGKTAMFLDAEGALTGVTTGIVNPLGVEDSIITPNPGAPWSDWGTNNILPYDMREHIENCGVLNAALDAKARIAAGKGLQPFYLMNVGADGTEELEWCTDSEVHDWLDENMLFDLCLDFSYDKNAYGWRTGTFMLNAKRDKINRIFRKDVFETRLQKKSTSSGIIKNIYLCGDWKNNSSMGFNKNKHKEIKLLREGMELQDLMDRKSEAGEFAFADRRRRDGRQYYSLPMWYSAREWVKQARKVSVTKNAMIDNQIMIKYVVTIHKQYWIENVDRGWDALPTDKQTAHRNDTYDAIDLWLTGGSNAGKSLFTGSFTDIANNKQVPYVTVEAIDDKFKDGKLLPDSSAANSEILFAIMMNPALMGAGQPGGPYSSNAGGSNVRESYLVQMMLMEEERKMNTSMMRTVTKFNGWAARLEKERTIVPMSTPAEGQAAKPGRTFTPRLVYRYQSGLLTTLDTGKSTKETAL